MKLKEVVNGIKKQNNQAEYIDTEVRIKEQVENMAEFALDKFGAIDILINNAGTMPLAFFADHEKAYDAWERCLDINLKGTLNGICAVYDTMIQQGRGHIVNVSSIYVNYPVTGAGVYQATKTGIRYMSDSLRQEAQGKIKVTTVNPTGTLGIKLGAGIINPAAGLTVLGSRQKIPGIDETA